MPNKLNAVSSAVSQSVESNGSTPSRAPIVNNPRSDSKSVTYVKPAKVKSTSRKAMESALNRLRGLSKTNLDLATVARYHADSFRDKCINARKGAPCALTIGIVGDTDIPKLLEDTTLILWVRLQLAKLLKSAGYPLTIEGKKIILPGEFENIDLEKVKKGTGRLDSAVTLAMNGDESKIRKFLITEDKTSKDKGKKVIPLKDRLVKAVARYTETGDYTTEQDKAVLNAVAFIASHPQDIEAIVLALQSVKTTQKNSVIESSVEKVEKVDFNEKLKTLN